MSIEITHVRYGSTPKTEDVITNYKWRNEQTGEVNSSDKPAMVKWLDDKGIAWVGQNPRAQAVPVHPNGSPAYVRTVADGKYTNNLTNLPEF
jgi:hypothetical protein